MERNWREIYDADFSDLLGKTLVSIKGDVGSETMEFTTTDGEVFTLTYYQDCCASCSIEDICGDVAEIIGTPILLAEEVHSSEPDAELKAKREQAKAKAEAEGDYYWDDSDSETWTFYKLATIKGSITIRWYGSSNGYYSETATFEKLG